VFGSIGLPELIMIFAVALLLFGPKKLPEIGRTIGKALAEFRRASNELQRSLEEEVAAHELREARRDVVGAVSGIGTDLRSAFGLSQPDAPASSAGPAHPVSGDASAAPSPEVLPAPSPLAQGQAPETPAPQSPLVEAASASEAADRPAGKGLPE
jgi:sec-independent protein translocase protein TatA